MHQERNQAKGLKSGSCWLLGAALALGGCLSEQAPPMDPATEQLVAAAAAAEDPITTPFKNLPFVEASSATRVMVQKLPQPTALRETVAVHVKLPPPANKELEGSLVRVLGDQKNPQVLFRSDVLAELKQIPQSPGREFYTSFAQLDVSELERRAKNEEEIASGAFGEVTRESIVFNGRTPISRTVGAPVDVRTFQGGGLTPLSICPVRPVSTQASWGKSLLITDPAVVLDPARTWDPCTGAGTQGGVWTFAHLVREMAQNSGRTPEDFVKEWLSLWLNDYALNGSNVPARTNIFSQVIQPWATASGVSSALVTNPSTNRREVLLGGPLNLNISPFRLLAIVNRTDLGRSVGGGGYGGSSDAGELRFVFGLTRPSPWGGGTEATCGLRPFTVIFEYGVPRSGCQQVIDWARQWTQLASRPSFDATYLSQLQGMTQSVVLRDKAPGKGNRNAINQIRTNENTLNTLWQLREFTLSTQNFATDTETPVNGPLRPHTVALTPSDSLHNPNGGDPDLTAYVSTTVAAGLQTPLSVPFQCASSFSMPSSFNGRPLLGASSQIPANRWIVSGLSNTSAQDVCARKELSVNTCNGCHFGDTATNGAGGNLSFTHISPTSGIPARTSKFLTGGGPGFMFGVPDQQFGASVATWNFADLERRHQRLYDIATCSTCGPRFSLNAGILDQIQRLEGVVPFEPAISTGGKSPFKVGPITRVETVRSLLEVRPQFQGELRDEPTDFLRPVETFVH
ncbi:hypothetical protein I3V78_37320 [Archangium primigenium]|nr:hypothetical protein [Archangium primigenium]